MDAAAVYQIRLNFNAQGLFVIVIGALTPVGKITWWMSRLVPALYERVMARQLNPNWMDE